MSNDTDEARDLINVALEGNDIKPQRAKLLLNEIKNGDNHFETRIKLLGYFFTRYQSNRVIRRARKKQIFWFIENASENFFLANPFAVILKDEHPTDYAEFKGLWEKVVEKKPTSVSVLLNAAEAISFSEPGLARVFLERAVCICPDDERLKVTRSNIERRMQLRAPLKPSV